MQLMFDIYFSNMRADDIAKRGGGGCKVNCKMIRAKKTQVAKPTMNYLVIPFLCPLITVYLRDDEMNA